ncbi:hypothetical protein COCC4DRAFT_30577 [Bipolaris maydis ATCC 48331]|uniref:Uncharacterized protein n=2 Tax=Cochliobolus heterostrophus TaxID=5016 RepID=M2U0S9_COCH5|nr:uncharacterized protein COCC4DRAFT_30577 [Bipolaris maydis ATCC 48331]EMD92159.1 hypothetical protein COCHEDRAFT_1021077 [Bipolaris maydis C5]ENI07849.1 hypothetical protein COCC4DRAFT_30577 [Bipolaris maydis ATCC 48331]
MLRGAHPRKHLSVILEMIRFKRYLKGHELFQNPMQKKQRGISLLGQHGFPLTSLYGTLLVYD